MFRVERLLKTGEVAVMLGVSRQHVVDLCDRGAIGAVRVGTHRRIPRREAERLARRQLTRQDEKSLWLHGALMSFLLADPDGVLDRARSNLVRWAGFHREDGMTRRYFAEWEHVLADGLDEVIDTLTSRSEKAIELRHNSPFAGVLPDESRTRVLKAFYEHWKRKHEGAPLR